MNLKLRMPKNDLTRFLIAYVVTGLLVVLIPVVRHASAVARYKKSYSYQQNMYNHQQGQQEKDNSEVSDSDCDYMFDANKCRWFNPFCAPLWRACDGDNSKNVVYMNSNVPSWYSGWGNGNEGGNARMENYNSKAIKFVYGWQLTLFLGLLAFGALVLHGYAYQGDTNLAQSRVALSFLSIMIFMWGNLSMLFMWLLANGSIYDSGAELEEIGGFYNQFSVMVFTTNFWYLIWSLCFSFLITKRVPEGAPRLRWGRGEDDVTSSGTKSPVTLSYGSKTEKLVSANGSTSDYFGA